TAYGARCRVTRDTPSIALSFVINALKSESSNPTAVGISRTSNVPGSSLTGAMRRSLTRTPRPSLRQSSAALSRIASLSVIACFLPFNRCRRFVGTVQVNGVNTLKFLNQVHHMYECRLRKLCKVCCHAIDRVDWSQAHRLSGAMRNGK